VNSVYKKIVRLNNKEQDCGVQEGVKTEKQIKRRHQFRPITQFPLSAQAGELIMFESRSLPTKRLNDIEVKTNVTYADFSFEFHHHNYEP
jgi:hypothetical protein